MQLPRYLPRFTVSGLMVAVAGLSFLIVILDRVVWPWCEVRAAEFRRLELYHGSTKWVTERGLITYSGTLTPRRNAYHAALSEKYEWASRHPWLPVWPDPTEPE